MIGSGIRVGATYTMQIGDLIETEYGNHFLYKVFPYARTRDKYLLSVRLNATKQSMNILTIESDAVKNLKDKSPLFRKHFNKNDPFTINVPHFLSEAAVMRLRKESRSKDV